MRRWIAACTFVLLLTACSFIRNPEHTIEYLDKPCIQPVSRYDYRTCAPLKVKINGELVIIPKGFVTDMASIPKPLWWLLSPQYSGFVYPAVVHDYMYRCPSNHTRYFADSVFYSSLLQENISNFTARKMYYAVRVFGGRTFQKGNQCMYKNAETINQMALSKRNNENTV